MIIDATSYESLKSDDIVYEVELQPQMSTSDFEALVEAAEVAAKVGVALSFWQIVLFFSLGKALKSMWSLINACQFIIYISLWQIKLSDKVRLMLNQLRRIVFGEFLDDLDIASKITEFFGLSTKKSEITEEEVGIDRLGSSDLFDNFGPTLIIGSIIFVIFVALLIGTIYLHKKMKVSEKTRKRVHDLKRKVFYNSFIRYLLLNGLKFYMSAFMVLS